MSTAWQEEQQCRRLVDSGEVVAMLRDGLGKMELEKPQQIQNSNRKSRLNAVCLFARRSFSGCSVVVEPNTSLHSCLVIIYSNEGRRDCIASRSGAELTVVVSASLWPRRGGVGRQGLDYEESEASFNIACQSNNFYTMKSRFFSNENCLEPNTSSASRVDHNV